MRTVTDIGMIKDGRQRIGAFAEERYCMYLRRKDKEPKPWTQDPILRDYRFCNVFREHDAVTVWIAKNWRKPRSKEKHLWFAMCVARLFNQPSTLEVIGYPKPWHPLDVLVRLRDLTDAGKRVFNAAYIVSTNGQPIEKIDYVVNHVLEPMWKDRERYAPQSNDSLASFHERLTWANGMGDFMAAQVVADMKHTPQLKHAKDWWTWAVLGPGSRRGLNRVMGRDIHFRPKQEQALRELGLIRSQIEEEIAERMCLQDTQNCLCEFDKYERARLGEGRPKQRYAGI